MFRDTISTRIETTKPFAEVQDLVEERFSSLGRASITNSGTIMFSYDGFSGFAYTNEISGRLEKRKDYYVLELDFNAKPDILAWIIGICLFPIGFLVFILPYNANEAFKKKGNRIFDDLKFDLEKDDMV